MPTLNRYTLATLLAALPLVAAQDAPGPTGPTPGAPEGASDKQGDEGMAKYAEWHSNDYDCGMSSPPSFIARLIQTVINCLQVFNGVTSLERKWVPCQRIDADNQLYT